MNPQTIKDLMEYHMCTYEEAADLMRDMASLNYDRRKDRELEEAYERQYRVDPKDMQDLPF